MCYVNPVKHGLRMDFQPKCSAWLKRPLGQDSYLLLYIKTRRDKKLTTVIDDEQGTRLS